jgi:hypothetical protein
MTTILRFIFFIFVDFVSDANITFEMTKIKSIFNCVKFEIHAAVNTQHQAKEAAVFMPLSAYSRLYIRSASAQCNAS